MLNFINTKLHSWLGLQSNVDNEKATQLSRWRRSRFRNAILWELKFHHNLQAATTIQYEEDPIHNCGRGSQLVEVPINFYVC